MHTKVLCTVAMLVMSAWTPVLAIDPYLANVFSGQDLHLSGQTMHAYQPDSSKSILVFDKDFSMSIGANTFTSNGAVVWLQMVRSDYQGRPRTDYYSQVYLQGDVSVKKGKTSKTTDVTTQMQKGDALIVRFVVTGDVFATAVQRLEGDPNSLKIYQDAAVALAPVKYEPFEPATEPNVVEVDQDINSVPEVNEPNAPETKPAEPNMAEVGFEAPATKIYTYPEAKVPTLEEEFTKARPGPRKPWLIEEFFTPANKPLPIDTAAAELAALQAPPASAQSGTVATAKGTYQYPVNIAPVGETKPKIESAATTMDGISAATITGRFYVWQKTSDRGDLLEFQADNAVIFYDADQLAIGQEKTGKENLMAAGIVRSIYFRGDVVVTEGSRTIRADEFYYDFPKHAGLAVHAEMKTFDQDRGIPLYVRASRLRQLSASKFEGDKIVLTTSEFYVPQLSMQASKIVITDTTQVNAQGEKIGDNKYVADLRDVRFKFGKTTLMKFNTMQTNGARPDVPIKSANVGLDDTYGLGVETKWYLSRLLGLRQPEGTDTTLMLDAYSKRGAGAGVNVEYEREKYFGRMLSYIMFDTGEDRLGRIGERKDLSHPDVRGRFTFQHRQFLQDGWTLTLEASYLSDKNFLEEYERGEFTTGKEQETVVHLKKIQDNWGFSILGKWRINGFQDQLEELPTVEYHRTGESIFDNKATLYSDTQVSRYRQRIGSGEDIDISQQGYTFAYTRNEMDLPLTVQTWKFVPYVAGTAAYDDRSGFKRSLVDGQNTGPAGDYQVGIGEVGLRWSTQFWNVYPDAKSRLFDVREIRHLMKPYMVASAFTETSDDVEQRNTVNVGLLQRWQTKRGTGDKERTIDWMRLDTSATVVENPADAEETGPDRFIWNKPLVPMRVYSAPQIFNGDLADINPTLTHFEMWGPRRDMFQTDYIWRTTDTLAVLGDLNYDIQSQEVQQVDVGYSHLAWPNLSYYLGSRYLKRTDVLNETGSNVFTAAITYAINPRYTITFAQQYDFDYGASLRNEVTIIRRYHRIYYGLSFSTDASLDTQTVMLSIWPEGVPELAVGSRRYTSMTEANRND